MELIPTRSSFRLDDPVGIELDGPTPTDGVLSVWHLATKVHEQEVPSGVSTIQLGTFERGGYGVELRLGTSIATTAFDVLADAFERPRYGFIVTLTNDVDTGAVARNYRRLHLSLAQLYDWAYRHSQLLPPTEHYTDPLGQARDLGAVNGCARSSSVQVWFRSAIRRSTRSGAGRETSGPIPSWFAPTANRTGSARTSWFSSTPASPCGCPTMSSSWPPSSSAPASAAFTLTSTAGRSSPCDRTASGVDLAAAFPTLLAAVRARLPLTPFMFNNVNDFPTYATARAPQNATYIEVWPPHSTLADLGRLAIAARSYRPEHPPILSAYLSCYAQDEHRANACATLVMATVFSHGATHLLLGEDSNVLTDPYYPRNHRIDADSLDLFVRWYDFHVRYGDLLLDETQVDVTESFTGGINEDLVFRGPYGVVFSTQARPGNSLDACGEDLTRTGHSPHQPHWSGRDRVGRRQERSRATAWDHAAPRASGRTPSPDLGNTRRGQRCVAHPERSG